MPPPRTGWREQPIMAQSPSGRGAKRLPSLTGFILLALCSCGLADCAPRLQLPGPANTAPRLSDDVIVTPDGVSLPLRRWAPDGPPKVVVLALHGFNDYSNAFDDPGQAWANYGVITYAYDQRGFGAAPNRGIWAGAAAYADDLRLAAALLRDRHPGLPLYILGESMGGAVTMVAMASATPPDSDGVILVAPAVWGRDFMPIYQTIPLWFSAHLMPWMHLTGKGLKIRPSDNIEMLRKFSADPLVIKETRVDAIHGLVDLMDAAQAAAPKLSARSLILYGLQDEVVPDKPTFAMIKQLPEFDPPRHRLALYSKGYHMLMRDLQAATVIEDALVWMGNPSQPLPSGAEQSLAATSSAARSGTGLPDTSKRP